VKLHDTDDPCPLCLRPNLRPSDHHLVPKSRGGKVTLAICGDCHRAIHAVFSNKELATTYHTVDALLAQETLARMVAFIARQDPRRRVQVARTRDRSR
jgi:5-methylcytosine-specific restriction enzyme A